MANNNSLRRDLQKDLRIQLDQCRNRYRILNTMSDEIATEMKQCREHYINCFIQHQLLDHTLLGTSTKTETMTMKYKKRFKYGDKIQNDSFESHYHKYNFGDVIYDGKFGMDGVVVNETKVFVTLWYHTNSEDEFCSKKRKKKDGMLQVMKRCTLVF